MRTRGEKDIEKLVYGCEDDPGLLWKHTREVLVKNISMPWEKAWSFAAPYQGLSACWASVWDRFSSDHILVVWDFGARVKWIWLSVLRVLTERAQTLSVTKANGMQEDWIIWALCGLPWTNPWHCASDSVVGGPLTTLGFRCWKSLWPPCYHGDQQWLL